MLRGRHGYESDLSGSKRFVSPSKHVWIYGWDFLDSKLVKAVVTEDLTCLQVVTLPYHQPEPFPPAHPLIHATCDITVVKKLSQNLAVLVS